MTSIDEIMGAIGRHGDDCIRDADAASASFEALRELIAAALADAERKGAEAMRMLAARVCGLDAIAMATRDQVRGALMCEQTIRALPLPLPTGERKDEPLVCDVCGAECADPWHYSSGERRHMHACDACWPGVRKQGGGRQAVLLTDEQIERAVDGHGWTVSELQVEDIPGMARDIEAAVLAANDLGVRRG